MACFFCDSSPMTNNAVEHLAAIRLTIGVSEDMEPPMVLSRLQDIMHESAYLHERNQNLENDKQKLKSAIAGRDQTIGQLQEQIINMNERRPPEPTRLSSSPMRMSGDAGHDTPWYARSEAWRKRNQGWS